MKNQFLFVGVFGCASALGCSPVKSRPETNWSEQSCESKVELSFPDGSWAEYDGCKDVSVDANYEFDPDDPPEILNYKLQFNGFSDPNVECWMVLTAYGVCGPGYYGIGSAHSATVEFSTFDCPYVPDLYEDNYMANRGTILLEEVSAGIRTGDFTDEPLLTTISGSFDAQTTEGVEIIATWSVSAFIRADDGEEADCDQLQ